MTTAADTLSRPGTPQSERELGLVRQWGNAGARPAPLGRDLLCQATYSPREVGAHLGLCRRAVWQLLALGDEYGHELHPTRGGLWGSFKAGARTRCVPLESVQAHKAHFARLSADPVFCRRQAARAARLGLENEAQRLDAQAARLERAQREVAA